ncbi:pirin [Kwoniella mangroviensis CBS 8886]|uniref:uncharacterized protein n=1 Tax=Kwoniella mangroviensis CBS 8507 TaxID=1296122 RepID=UPI00080D294B|nr:pirin [Kwoniella mangroviensis CBS 8507]OCF66135.1 pirin [Kwoniella mangroviensis CBS 8507]OCF71225.1 pirin [Kwoniella mangroviensis CBS 8886]
MSTATTQSPRSRSVVKTVYANEVSEGVGAKVRRSIGSPELRNLSPFLMLDHFRATPGAGFPDHPHRGQTTVTYMIDGMSKHEIFLGDEGLLEPGDVQWMTAGKGIMHSEIPYFDPDPTKAVTPVGLQLWINLPREQKFIEPSYQEKKAKDIDVIIPSDGVEITMISGESHGIKGFVRPVGGCWYFNIRLTKSGAKVFQSIPEGWTTFIYIVSGKIQIGDDPTIHDKFNTSVLSSQNGQSGVHLQRPEGPTDDEEEETRFILVAGLPLDQPVVQYGPFVVNTNRQAMEAIRDFQSGKNGFENAVGWESKIGKEFRAH